MNKLEDLKRQLSVIGIIGIDQKGNYRSAADIYKDIGVVYQKFYNAGVSTSDMKLLDRVYYDIMIDWDRLVENEKNKSCNNGAQVRKTSGTREEYTELVGGTNKSYVWIMDLDYID